VTRSRRGRAPLARPRPRLTAELLRTPVRHAASVLVLAFIDVLVEKRHRLPYGADGLHDFRVALRRLRSWRRALRPWLPDAGRERPGRALASLADASNDARDAEVGLEWLESQRGLPPQSHREVGRLVRRLRRERRIDSRGFNARVARELDPVVAALRRQLMARADFSLQPSDENPAMRGVHAALIRAHASELGAALARVRSVDDEVFAHRARIVGKRLRYLIEAMTGNRKAKQLLARMRRLQDALGELHDATVLGAHLETLDPVLAARARARTEAAFSRVRRNWLGARGRELCSALVALGGGATQQHAVL